MSVSYKSAPQALSAFREEAFTELAKPSLPIGTRVRIAQRVGVICAENDPHRDGTFHSQQYGEVPVKWLGNRAKRRSDEAKARAAR